MVDKRKCTFSSFPFCWPCANFLRTLVEKHSFRVRTNFSKIYPGASQQLWRILEPKTTNLFEASDALSDEEPFCYYMLYMESGFSIPVAKEDVSSIRAMMTDPDHFEQYLQDRSRYEDAITNRDI